jgi:hypothetical protein
VSELVSEHVIWCWWVCVFYDASWWNTVEHKLSCLIFVIQCVLSTWWWHLLIMPIIFTESGPSFASTSTSTTMVWSQVPSSSSTSTSSSSLTSSSSSSAS